jgi:aspartate aminotransferase-like enzyme
MKLFIPGPVDVAEDVLQKMHFVHHVKNFSNSHKGFASC